MVELTKGDILSADAEALINTVNCVGVMGRGVALQFRKAYPENFKAYESACKRKEVRLGEVFVHDLHSFINPRYIINFPTKDHWKGSSRLSYIESGLRSLIGEVEKLGIRSLALPPLGCGLGGLDWREVRPLIEAAFAQVPWVHVLLFEPVGAPSPATMPKSNKKPSMSPGKAVLLGLMDRYLAALMDPFVTLLELHKLMYFMQEAGEALRLNYTKGTYGPYAENLRHVLNAIDGHYISGYGDGEDSPTKQIEPNAEAVGMALAFLEECPQTRERFERVIDLIEGFETSYGMELLSTVHWVAKTEGAGTPEKAVQFTHAWNDRKRTFEPRHIRVAWDILDDKGWLF
ncbi:type II toxin-antitoxin system antitoxin DNA ADP-ribosyl glycohydrolase DarG [Gloeobacter violaceus]|uniref:Glr3371 protein n=1 Tax=Gloeobacter violaceus (strain ATCC 29082 / PCC 7421) TaxID=251221 RepID=Q7NG03_GLOVI|nr:macro domain-containing protein [Gloeobacter violaceus]BAC91312.1 glr3371 [Gloeobacter violaceus PCC 7421]